MVGGLNRRNFEFLDGLHRECEARGENFYKVLAANSHRMMPEDQFTGRSMWDVTLSYLGIDRRPPTPPTLDEFKQNYR